MHFFLPTPLFCDSTAYQMYHVLFFSEWICYSSDTVFTEFQCQSMQKSPLGWASLPNMLKDKSRILYNILLSHSPPHIIKGTLFSQWPRTKTLISPSTSLSPDLSQNIFSALPSKYIRHMTTLYHCYPDLSRHHPDYRLIPSWSLPLPSPASHFTQQGKPMSRVSGCYFPLEQDPKFSRRPIDPVWFALKSGHSVVFDSSQPQGL